MKRFFFLMMACLLLSMPVFADTPTELEVQESTVGVFKVFSMVFLMTMLQTPVDGATVEMDMNTGSSTIVFDDLDVAALLSQLAELAQRPEDEEPIPFSHLSGTFTSTSEGAFDLDFQLTGGPIGHIKMVGTGDILESFEADGVDYTAMAQAMEFGN